MRNLGPDEAPQLVPAASLMFIHPHVYLLSATSCAFWTLSQVLGECANLACVNRSSNHRGSQKGSRAASGKRPLANIHSHSRDHRCGRGLGGMGQPLQPQGLSQPSSCAQAGPRIPWSAAHLLLSGFFFFNFLFGIGVQPISNALIVSSEQQRDSAKHKCVSILPQTPDPSTLSRSVEQSSLWWRAGPCHRPLLHPSRPHEEADLPHVGATGVSTSLSIQTYPPCPPASLHGPR